MIMPRALSAWPVGLALLSLIGFADGFALLHRGMASGVESSPSLPRTSASARSCPSMEAHSSRRALVQWLPLAAALSVPSDPQAAPAYPQQKSEEEWAEMLSERQRFVLREGGTEPPNSSPLVLERRPGAYRCAGCGAALFSSASKFEARTGWPSFADAEPRQVEVAKVPSFLETLNGAECKCASCGCRIGERFLDGTSFPGTSAARTGKRFSINGAALDFEPEDDDSQAVSGDAYPSTAAGSRRQFEWRMRDGGLRSI